jgi:metal-sulfur cluster biosynthetic enzyme
MHETADAGIAPILEALRSVMDPELGVNVVDLGLVYGVEQYDDGDVYVTMTVTTPTCPIGSFLEQQVRWAVMSTPGVGAVEVEVVHTPPWSPALMSDTARSTLGWSS